MNESPDATGGEAELRRRLEDVAAAITIDQGAWEKVRTRIAATPGGRKRPAPWHVLAVAAALAVLMGAVVLACRDDDGSHVETRDERTSTTDQDPVTTTSEPAGAQPADQPGTGEPGGPGGPGAGDGGSGGGPQPTAGSPTGTGGPVTSNTAPAPPSSGNTAPDGRIPVVTFASSEDVNVVATVWKDSTSVPATLHMTIWQSDQNPYRYLASWSWEERSGQSCLAGANGVFDFGPWTFGFSWGLARSDAVDIYAIVGSNRMPTARGGEVLPGLRPWIAQTSPAGPDRFEAWSQNDLLHTAAPPTWDAYPDTC